ncbi:MAG: hypothetical protein AAGA75_22300, partial [Cyanobacteria bacterium P01_E01_bin.6]
LTLANDSLFVALLLLSLCVSPIEITDEQVQGEDTLMRNHPLNGVEENFCSWLRLRSASVIYGTFTSDSRLCRICSLAQYPS